MKIKETYFALILLSFVTSLSAIESEKDLIDREIQMMDNLITSTQELLDNQLKMRGLVKEYQKIQKQYMSSSEDNELLFRMVKTAHTLLEMITQNHMTQSFDPAFINELTIVSKPAAKRGLPKP